ncbi:MAG TPA: 4Fe-4S ferredoxin, partial [Anaeromyxobacter sp.]|nr:4Fe-4S ferredoxin [Anaeromyxobacter sp.]
MTTEKRTALPVVADAPLDPARRAFLRTAAAGAAVASMSACGVNLDDFLRRHFKELSPEELKRVLAKVEQRNRDRFGKETKVSATGARPGVEFGYGLDLSRCIGCRR